MTDEQILNYIAEVAILWPNFRAPLTQGDGLAMVQTYRPLLADLDAAMVHAVVLSMATEGRPFAPTPGELRRALVDAGDPTPSPAVDQAWGELLAAIRHYGYTGAPEWSHPALAQVVEHLGGWVHICQTWMDDDEVANRAHFMRLYPLVVDRLRPDAVPPRTREQLDAMRRVNEVTGRIGKPLEIERPAIVLDDPLPPELPAVARPERDTDPAEFGAGLRRMGVDAEKASAALRLKFPSDPAAVMEGLQAYGEAGQG